MAEQLNNINNLKEEAQPPFTNKEWVELLQGSPDERAVKELRRLLIQGLKPALHSYVDRELDQFVEDVAQDGIIKILDNIETFRGESKFMTWAMKIAVREGLTVLRRKRWDNVSLDRIKEQGVEENTEIYSEKLAGELLSPESTAAQKMIVEKIGKMVQNILTDHQRRAFRARIIEDMPSFIVAEELGTNRNNLYKLLYDARKKIKNELEVQGIDPDQMLAEISES